MRGTVQECAHPQVAGNVSQPQDLPRTLAEGYWSRELRCRSLFHCVIISTPSPGPEPAGKNTNAIVAGLLHVRHQVWPLPDRRRPVCPEGLVHRLRPVHPGRVRPESHLSHHTEIALEQAERILAAGVTVWWATDCEVYGRNSTFRRFFETRDVGYVVAVGVDFHINLDTGPKRADLIARTRRRRRSTGEAAARVPAGPGLRLSHDRHQQPPARPC